MKKLGGPVKCPICGGSNPSGFNDPDRCRWCGKHKVDYSGILSRIETLMDAEPDTPELDELKRLTAIVEKYEDIHYPMRGM